MISKNPNNYLIQNNLQEVYKHNRQMSRKKTYSKIFIISLQYSKLKNIMLNFNMYIILFMYIICIINVYFIQVLILYVFLNQWILDRIFVPLIN